MQQLRSNNTEHSLAVVVGANGGLGSALMAELGREKLFARHIGFSRQSTPSLDLLSEASIVECARHIGAIGIPRLVIDATGFLYDAEVEPEKSLRQLTPEHLAKAFAVNAIGPA
nr:C-factor [Rhodocyclaceae bacterium]